MPSKPKTPEEKAAAKAAKEAAAAAKNAAADPAVEEARRAALTDEERAAEDAAREAAAGTVTGSKNAVSVSWNGGVREFSKEVHGADFKALAQEFADTHDGELVA